MDYIWHQASTEECRGNSYGKERMSLRYVVFMLDIFAFPKTKKNKKIKYHKYHRKVWNVRSMNIRYHLSQISGKSRSDLYIYLVCFTLHLLLDVFFYLISRDSNLCVHAALISWAMGGTQSFVGKWIPMLLCMWFHANKLFL